MIFNYESSGVVIFDMEARPTAWIGGDFVGRSMTAFAFSYLDDDEVYSWVLSREDGQEQFAGAVIELASAVETASLVVGHWIRGFDLPLLNTDLERVRNAPLRRVMTIDTKSDRSFTQGISQSLENLSSRYELEQEKMAMHEPWWEEFNLWQTPRTVELVRERVVSDVVGTKELYSAMLAAGRLKSPKAWDPSAARSMRYGG